MDPLTIQPSLDLNEEGPRRSSRLRDQDSCSKRENIDVNQSNTTIGKGEYTPGILKIPGTYQHGHLYFLAGVW